MPGIERNQVGVSDVLHLPGRIHAVAEEEAAPLGAVRVQVDVEFEPAGGPEVGDHAAHRENGRVLVLGLLAPAKEVKERGLVHA